jgi:hypothetical protein
MISYGGLEKEVFRKQCTVSWSRTAGWDGFICVSYQALGSGCSEPSVRNQSINQSVNVCRLERCLPNAGVDVTDDRIAQLTAYTETRCLSPALVILYKLIGLHDLMHTPEINRNLKVLAFVLYHFFFRKNRLIENAEMWRECRVEKIVISAIREMRFYVRNATISGEIIRCLILLTFRHSARFPAYCSVHIR